MKTVLVTGGKGQLASCIKEAAKQLKTCRFIYVDYDELNITKEKEVIRFFEKEDIHFCVNCAAYTAVDKAESEPEMAKRINLYGAFNLAKACKVHDAKLIQISTDFVFDGEKSEPYIEFDTPNPLGVYGQTKLDGERAVASVLEEHFIIRTAWLYSLYGNNFLKTMLRLKEQRDELKVINDQLGTPTYAGDLAKVILKIITEDFKGFGTYHYSNEGMTSWYDFAKAIFDVAGLEIRLIPIATKEYPTLAKRPVFSVLDKTKIKEHLKIHIPHWQESLYGLLNSVELS